MSKKMLIDAAHPEEVRVAVLSQNKIEDFDFESAAKKPLRGNIYLARVTRVEPSLQAAFVDYGGNRHGFLAFSEIHPDYYQIPVSDRQLLQKAEQEVAALAADLELAQRGDDDDDDDHDDDSEGVAARQANSDEDAAPRGDDDDRNGEEEEEEEEEREEDEGGEPQDEKVAAKKSPDAKEDDASEPADEDAPASDASAEEDAGASDDETSEDQSDVGEDEAAAAKNKRSARDELFERYKDAKRRRSQLLRNYKIQEVIKRRQILLIQVVKEERGNKGAALTTYLSLAGRYCVLMPNTARGGGISRKISHGSDRRRLRRVVDSLDVPQGMGLIIRTAGSKRTKTEIKRDYDYLLRMWENIRSLTLKSIAPCLIYEEASLIKRAIRDLYDKDISKVYVEGEEGYREAKDFMKMLMPSHAKNVQPHKDKAPIFLKYGVEAQLDGMYQPTVRLKSGGYLVIHQTEALVAIDVNSGRATRERNIEQTALRTNIEAAEEAARQFRLRDLAGLIVIDFIDMEEPRNNRKVEKALKEAMKTDRARVQIGRISSFGLLELSRQRRRSGIVDGTTRSCPTCAGAGVIRSHDIAALRILRALEGEALAGKAGRLCVRTSTDVALHVLNHNRDWLRRIEAANGVAIEVIADPDKYGDDYDLEKSGAPRERTDDKPVVRADQTEPVEADEPDGDAEEEDEDRQAKKSEDRPKRRRRKRRARKDRDDENVEQSAQDDADQSDDADEEAQADAAGEDAGDEKPKKRRRRGRRGGRRNKKEAAKPAEDDASQDDAASQDDEDAEKASKETADDAGAETAPEAASADEDDQPAEPVVELADIEPAGAKDAVNGEDAPDEAAADGAPEDDAPETAETPAPAPKKRAKRGWWQRSAS